MKKITFSLMTAGLLLTFQPTASHATTVVSSTQVDSQPTEATEANGLLIRLDEINKMDKSHLKSSEKQNLRREVRSIKHRLSLVGGGVYISVGAIIIIVLLLIILF